MAGTREAIERCRTHPLARAVRIDKLSLAALEAVLRLHRDAGRDAARSIPVLAMLTAPSEELGARAELLRDGVGPAARRDPGHREGGRRRAAAARAERPGVRRGSRAR